jgi:hypothetical protein
MKKNSVDTLDRIDTEIDTEIDTGIRMRIVSLNNLDYL